MLMTATKKNYFHCAKCDSLFEASIVSVGNQKCSNCGRHPGGKLIFHSNRPNRQRPFSESDNSSGGGMPQSSQGMHSQLSEEVKVKSRDLNSSRLWPRVFGLILIVGIGVLVYQLMAPEKLERIEKVDDEDTYAGREVARLSKEKDYLNKEIPKCLRTYNKFLEAGNAAEKSQFVYKGSELSPEMDRYYSENVSLPFASQGVEIVDSHILDHSGKKIIGLIVKNANDELFEIIFVKNKDEWKIDWEFFVRNDTRSWLRFLDEDHGAEGVFRLYVRFKATVEGYDYTNINFVFYKPEIYRVGKYRGEPSPNVIVSLNETSGKILKLIRDKGSKLDKDFLGFDIGKRNPDGYHRVRVKLRVIKREGFPDGLELVDILANHWYGEDIIKQSALPEVPGESGLPKSNRAH